VRDIFLALPSDQADELGRLIMALRETWGALPQGEVILKACRVAHTVYALESEEPSMTQAASAADVVFEVADEDS
jgi:hypothetical protein